MPEMLSKASIPAFGYNEEPKHNVTFNFVCHFYFTDNLAVIWRKVYKLQVSSIEWLFQLSHHEIVFSILRGL